MTDRFNAFTVVLEKDIREDDAQAIMAAMKQLRGVLSVEGNVSDISDHVAQTRVRHDLGQQMMRVLYPKSQLS